MPDLARLKIHHRHSAPQRLGVRSRAGLTVSFRRAIIISQTGAMRSGALPWAGWVNQSVMPKGVEHAIENVRDFPARSRGAYVTVGNFDGVHRGHQRLLGRLRARADAARVPALALTFDPHPVALLRPDK